MNTLVQHLLNELSYSPQNPVIFNSGLFLFLFVAFSAVYYLLRNRDTARILFVTLFSYYFYYKSSGFYFLLLGLVTTTDFLLARGIDRHRDNRSLRRLLLTVSILIDMGFLAYFKYTNFFAGMVSQIIGNNFQPWDIFLPVGISFFTFQSLSYTIDVYRDRLKPLDSLLDYAFYVSFFPQLVAGPIVRARDFAPQIRRRLEVSETMVARGVFMIAIGLFKKAVISDYISLNFVDRIFDNPSLYSGFENLLGLYSYSLQIYCDFSGYSDMAIGLALLLGFHFPDNFNAPFKAQSMTDFWHRWHISLSSWIRDYVYISMGGNRRGKVMTYVNLVGSMLLCGLWHGASWNFVVWGGIHGLLLAAHKFLRQNILHHDKHYQSTGWKRVAAVFLTFQAVAFMFMIFRMQTWEGCGVMLSQIFTNFHPELVGEVVASYRYILLLVAFGFVSHFVPDRLCSLSVCALKRGGLVLNVLVITVIIFIVIQIKSSQIQPFIYFQF